jgi:surface protein
MFSTASIFNQNIGSWNTLLVANMSGMFYNASKFNQNISSWNTSQVTDMKDMFYGASAFNNIDIPLNTSGNSWNTSQVTTMSNMFNSASTFNQNIGSWNVSRVTNMINMLDGTAISTDNYNSLLTGWSSQILKLNVTLGALGLTYLNTTGRNILTTTYNWTIVGDNIYVPPSYLTISSSSESVQFNSPITGYTLSTNLENPIYSISPSIENTGLTFNTSTGLLSGNPINIDKINTTTTYTITNTVANKSVTYALTTARPDNPVLIVKFV